MGLIYLNGETYGGSGGGGGGGYVTAGQAEGSTLGNNATAEGYDVYSTSDYGHAEGDIALQLTSKALKKAAGATDYPVFLSRYGGDEFAIIAHTPNPEDIEKLIKNIREEIKENCQKQNLSYVITISVGYDVLGNNDDTLQKCLKRADNNLYIDKKNYKKELTKKS